MARSGFDADALPEGDMVFDVGGCGVWLRVIPGAVLNLHAVHFDVVVVGRALPRADRGMGAGLQEFLIHGVWREVLMALDFGASTALGQYFAGPSSCGRSRISPSTLKLGRFRE